MNFLLGVDRRIYFSIFSELTEYVSFQCYHLLLAEVTKPIRKAAGVCQSSLTLCEAPLGTQLGTA